MKKNPTNEQRKVINCDSQLISLSAPGGTGKTDCLIWYILKQIKSGKHIRIIMVTLTNSAADTVNERFEDRNNPYSNSFKASTFHSFAKSILPNHAKKIGYQNNFSVVPGITEKILKRIVNEHKSRLKELNKPYEVIKEINDKFLRSNHLIKNIAQEYIQKEKTIKLIRKIILGALKERKRLNEMDFDDLTFNLYKLLKNNDSVLQSIVTDYPLMIVDEFQDTTDIQWKAMKLFIRSGIQFLGAGDPYQTLYRFVCANLKRFNQLSAISGCKEFQLTKNFRSTMQIVSISNAIRSQLPGYKGHEIRSEDTGPKPQVILSHRKGLLIEDILSKIHAHREKSTPLKEMAITFRFDGDARLLAKKLIGWKVPFVSYLKENSTSEFKDVVLSIIKIVQQQGERKHWRKIIPWFQGIGKKNINTVLDLLRKEYYQFEDIKYLRRKRYKTDFNKLLKLLREIQKLKNNPFQVLHDVRDFYSSLGKTREIKDYNPYWTTMLKIVHKSANLQEFLLKYQDSSYGMYYPSNRDVDEGEFITLSNIHKIKGKEFKVVFILGSYDTMFENHNTFDDDDLIKDEIMIMDTAVTRSKRYLYFLFPMTKKEWDERKHKKNPSIFIRNCSKDLSDIYKPYIKNWF